MSDWSHLPDEVMDRVGMYMSNTDVGRSRLACKSWAASVTSGAKEVTVRGPAPRAVGRMFSRLESLIWDDASHTALAESILEGLLSFNIVCSNPARVIGEIGGVFRCLQSLEISPYVQDEVRDISTIARISSLTRLNLSHNDISDANGLEALGSLTELDLSHNSCLNNAGVSAFARMSALKMIRLHHTRVPIACPHLGHATFLHLGAKWHGDMWGHTVENVDEDESSLVRPSLTELFVVKAMFRGDGFFKTCPNLVSIKFRDDCGLDHDAKRGVCDMTSLTRLNLTGCNLESEEIPGTWKFWSEDDISMLPRRITHLSVMGAPLKGIRHLEALIFLELVHVEHDLPYDMNSSLEGLEELPSLQLLALEEWRDPEGIKRAARRTGLKVLAIKYPDGAVDASVLEVLANTAWPKSFIVDSSTISWDAYMLAIYPDLLTTPCPWVIRKSTV